MQKYLPYVVLCGEASPQPEPIDHLMLLQFLLNLPCFGEANVTIQFLKFNVFRIETGSKDAGHILSE